MRKALKNWTIRVFIDSYRVTIKLENSLGPYCSAPCTEPFEATAAFFSENTWQSKFLFWWFCLEVPRLVDTVGPILDTKILLNFCLRQGFRSSLSFVPFHVVDRRQEYKLGHPTGCFTYVCTKLCRTEACLFWRDGCADQNNWYADWFLM
jgi:hypothetical protein